MIGWVLWGAMLLAQNASFTWLSRARNSQSLRYHGAAALAANVVWFLNLGLALGKLDDVRQAGSVPLFLFTAAFYTVFTTVGSLAMHHFLMTRVEKGSRRVSA